MCIIIYKPENVVLPTKEILQACWDNNDDGAGIVWWDDQLQQWQVRKGFMKFKRFYAAYKELNFTEQTTLLIHFRIGTSGNKDGGNTHPFPVSGDYTEMRQESFTSPKVIIHNGVVGTGDGIASDTMKFIKHVINPLSRYDHDPEIKAILDDILEKTKSRWAVLKSDKTVELVGTWVTEENKIQYSNTSYKVIRAAAYNNKQSAYAWRSHFRGHNNLDNPDDIYSHMKGGTQTEQVIARRVKNGGRLYADGMGNIIDTMGVKIKLPKASKALFINDTGEVIWGKKKQDVICSCCPTCFNDYMLESSIGNTNVIDGDTICRHCGACFDMHTGYVHFYDSDLCIDPSYGIKSGGK